MGTLLDKVRSDYMNNCQPVLGSWARKSPGESLWAVLSTMGMDMRQLTCTPDDPWNLRSLDEVESWIERRVLTDESGNPLRVKLV